MTIELTALQQQRRDTAANWTSANPTLLTGEIGYETDTGKFKIGDGSTVWTGLGYLPIPDSSGLIPISQLLLPLGSASAPSLTFTGDANTGVYSPGADQLAITTAGTPRVVVDSSGKVGIGETDVDALLVIKGDSNATTNPSIRLKDGADTREAWISNASGDLSLNVGGNDNVSHGTLKLFDSGVLDYSQAAGSALRIDSSGRVGVGTTSPSVNLDISPASGAAELKIAGAEGAEASIRLFADQGDDAADIKRLLTDTSGNFKIQHYAGSAFVDSMVIDSSGDVKIADYQSGTAGKNGFELRASGELVQNRNGGDAYTLYNNSSAKTITFQASGSATFAGTVIVGEYSSSATNASGARITASGQLNLQRQAGASADNRFQILDGLTVKASITNAGSATFGQASNSTNNNGVAVGGNNGTLNIYTTRYSVDAFQLINTSGSGTNVAVRFDGDGSATFAGNVLIGITSLNLASSNGVHLTAGGSSWFSATNDYPLGVNRIGTDGALINFVKAGTSQGSISVSGTDVTLNGATLSRWSQLPGGVERTEILRGSVLSNLDEMCEWAYEGQDAVLYAEEEELPEGVSVGDVKTPAVVAGTEDNEQMNRMKVSDVEGDRNVAGVFRCWDDDDDIYVNDFYCAMTGDFVIRIAQGTTIARGDLLMSAGDGTAKPQDDDIVRSKTVAKVTSTNVSETYADGSYCVPCVLMAC